MQFLQKKIDCAKIRNRSYASPISGRLNAEIADLGFDSFTVEDPFLNAFIPKEQFSEPMLKPQGGRILLSGFYTADIPLLLEKAASLGLHEISRRSRDDWALLVLEK